MYQASDPAEAGRKGLGLGLFICKELVVRQGGKLWVNSLPGAGSKFFVTLPIFSLATLIAPAFRRKSYLEDPITLVMTELHSVERWHSAKLRAEHSLWVRVLLRRCANSELDVLLPRLGVLGARELFFIVARTDEIGGEAITRRIREKLQTSEYLSQAGLSLSVSYRSLGSVGRNVNESMEGFLEKVAAKIHESMDEASSSRTVEHEQ